MGSGVLSCRSFLMKSTRSLSRRKISCLRPAQAGGGGGDLGGGRFGGGRLGAAVFLGVGLGAGFFVAGAAGVTCTGQQPASGVMSIGDARGLQVAKAGQQRSCAASFDLLWHVNGIRYRLGSSCSPLQDVRSLLMV